MVEEALRQKSREAVWALTKRRSSEEPFLRRRRAALEGGGTQRPSLNCLRAVAVTHNVELTGTRRRTAMPARSNMDLCVARAWTAAVGVRLNARLGLTAFGRLELWNPRQPELDRQKRNDPRSPLTGGVS